MRNLGKIIILFITALPVFAGLEVSVDKEHVTRGERVTFVLKVTGQGTLRVPPLDELCGYSIESRMQSRKDVFANGKRAQEISLIYEFMPQRSCVIEPFNVSINGVEEMTRAINITVSKMSIQKDEPFIVGLMTEKRSVYVGEPFEMRVDFKERQNMNSLAESVSLPESKNIWIKSEKKGQSYVKDRYKNRTNMYALSAQQSGRLSLGPLRWDLKVRSKGRDIWGTWLATSKTHTVFSNELDIEVKALPEGVELVGEMQIEVQVDKNEINAGEAVNLTINVKGRANIEDIADFSIYVDGAQAFNEEPKVTHYLQEGRYFGSFSQKSALVAEHDFEIPSFSLKYMDVPTNTVKTISSEAIPIKVLNSPVSVKEELKVSRPEAEPVNVNQKAAFLTLIQGSLLLLGGVVFGLIISMIPWKRLFTKERQTHKVSAKVSKEVLRLLMSNMHGDSEIEELVKKLSENFYEGKSHRIDIKRLKEILKRIQA